MSFVCKLYGSGLLETGEMSSGSEEECCSLVVVIVVMMGAFETVIRRLKIEEVKKIGGLC